VRALWISGRTILEYRSDFSWPPENVIGAPVRRNGENVKITELRICSLRCNDTEHLRTEAAALDDR